MHSQEKIESAVLEILHEIGEDVNRSGLKDTPHRVAKMFLEVTRGLTYKEDEIEAIINDSVFDDGGDEMIIERDIPFDSLCEHHLVNFGGTITVGYIPTGGRVVGLSKIPRIIDLLASRPQVQERLTSQVADVLMNSQLKPEGVGVIVKAEHHCMSSRGVRKAGVETITSAIRGSFKIEAETRAEWQALAYVR